VSATRYLVDTNILLRFLIGEPVQQAASVRQLFAQAGAGEILLEVPAVIVAEAYYTLHSFYKVERSETASKLLFLLQQRGIKLREANQVLSALESLQTVNVGFADAFLAAGAAEEKVSIASFDRDLDKFKGITRFEPTTQKKA